MADSVPANAPFARSGPGHRIRGMRLASRPMLALLAGCSVPPAGGSDACTSRLLDTIPPGVNVVLPPAFSRDGERVAWVAWTHDGAYAVCGDWRGKTYAVV